MRVDHLLTWSAFPAVQVLAQSLQSVLIDNGFTRFAAALEGHAVHVSGSSLIVYTPTNAALERNGGASVARRANIEDGIYVSEGTAAGHSTSTTKSVASPTETPGSTCKLRLKRAAEVPCGIVRETWLRDPAFVNLGVRRNQTVIERTVCGTFRPLVFSGLGASVQVIAEDIPFDRGVLRPIGGVFTMPRPVPETLQYLGTTRFLDALARTGLLAELDSRPAITILAPSDAAFRTATANISDAQLIQVLRNHVLVDFAAYTPLVRGGDVYATLGGGTVTASVVEETISFDGVQLLAGDAITKNGVIHTIDKVFLTTPSTTSPSPTASQSAVVTGVAAIMKPPSGQAVVFSVAALAMAARYFLG
ncbi:hypothetical protein OQA88_4436 [Cercophora sp. LCS_1]